MWVKICGITNPETAAQVAGLNPDAVGLNFYPQSSRYVAPQIASQFRSQFPKEIEVVGVFANADLTEIVETARLCQLDTIQLHGQESLEFLLELHKRLPDVHLIRARRLSEDPDSTETWAALESEIPRSQQLGLTSLRYLVDAAAPGHLGGTGTKAPWSLLKSYRHSQWPPLILAGGLNPNNITDAITQVVPWGVDVASGVESPPGVKSLELMEQFIRKTRQISLTDNTH